MSVHENESVVSNEAKQGGFSLPFSTAPLSAAADVARRGVQLGLGLAVLAVESAQKLGTEAIERGAKIEKVGRENLVRFEREQVAGMKDYLKRYNGSKKSQGTAVEAQVEEALKTFDVPTRDDIRELHLHLNSISEKISALGK